MRIAIATTGRFHLLDLARELSFLKNEVAFYSYVPNGKCEQFGLPAECMRSFLPLVAPLVLWQRMAPRLWSDTQMKLICHAMDNVVAARLEPCDVFIGMSGIFVKAAEVARRKYGAKVIIERGSQHIIAQRRILAQLGVTRLPGDFTVRRELRGYQLADRIAVPSAPVVESFLSEAPQLEPKLMVNPYGVDLTCFPHRTGARPSGSPSVLFVGGWSLRKGADLLIKAIRALPGVMLTHVGSLGDVEFPRGDSQFEHIGPVPQWDLPRYYAKADVLVLASREEGLALVQLQALSSGLPVVCTTRTGGGDLALSPGLADRIAVVPPDDAEALAHALNRTLDVFGSSWKRLPEAERAALSWTAYAERYVANLRALVEHR